MVVIENFKKKDARPHGILGYSTKRIERLTFCIHLILRRAFRYYIRNSYSLPQTKYLSAVNVLSAHVGIWNSCRNTYMIMVIDLRVHGVQKGRNYTSYVKMNESQRELDLIITSITRPKLRDTKFNYHFITLIWNRRIEIPNTRFYWFSSHIFKNAFSSHFVCTVRFGNNTI